MRAFIAVDIDERVRGAVGDIITRLKKGIQFTGANPAWVPVENMHLTLKFLGEIEESLIEKIGGCLKNVASKTKPFEVSLEKLGVFPHKHSPKVLWIGIKKGKDSLSELQSGLEEEMKSLGFTTEDRPFSPHLTLARIKSFRGVKGMMDVVYSHTNSIAGECIVNEIILFQSVLKKTGAEYTPITKVPFSG